MNWNRRQFLAFMGRATAFTALGPVVLQACSPEGQAPFVLKGISPSTADDFLLAEGLQYQMLLKRGDAINADGSLLFGDHCDYITYLPEPGNPTEGMLWVNHEYMQPILVSGFTGGEKTVPQIEKEMKMVGGSFVKVRQHNGIWEPVLTDPRNRRLDAWTQIPIVAARSVAGETVATGTMGNCAGGVTPWGTVLTCEENTEDYYGRVDFDADGNRSINHKPAVYQWYRMVQRPPEHYGWVVEVDPTTGAARKLTSMGRMAHECATVRKLSDGRCVVYTGDDEVDEHLYKFIADKPGSLETGTLYVADMEAGRWVSLDIREQPVLIENFTDQTEVLVRCREAAKMVGATPLDRPEDIEIDPANGAVIVTLTNNKPRNNYFGSLLRLVEAGDDPEAMAFTWDTFLAGGPESGFACPDNLAFDPKGNLWMTTDISGSSINKDPYKPFGHNGLFYIPMSGPDAGKPVQVASAPAEGELTGPWFAPDGRTLFLSVQHPGERTKDLNSPTSRWPLGGDNLPYSTVVAITGEMLDALMA